MASKVTYFGIIWGVGTLICLALQGVFPGVEETTVVSGLFKINFAEAGFFEVIWGGLQMLWDGILLLFRILSFEFIFLTGNFIYVRYLLIFNSIGFIWGLLATFLGR